MTPSYYFELFSRCLIYPGQHLELKHGDLARDDLAYSMDLDRINLGHVGLHACLIYD